MYLRCFVFNSSSFPSFGSFPSLLLFSSLSVCSYQKTFLMGPLVDLNGAIIRKKDRVGESAPLCSDIYFLLIYIYCLLGACQTSWSLTRFLLLYVINKGQLACSVREFSLILVSPSQNYGAYLLSFLRNHI